MERSTGTGSAFTYTSAAGYAGPDSFAYAVSDGHDQSPPVTRRRRCHARRRARRGWCWPTTPTGCPTCGRSAARSSAGGASAFVFLDPQAVTSIRRVVVRDWTACRSRTDASAPYDLNGTSSLRRPCRDLPAPGEPVRVEPAVRWDSHRDRRHPPARRVACRRVGDVRRVGDGHRTACSSRARRPAAPPAPLQGAIAERPAVRLPGPARRSDRRLAIRDVPARRPSRRHRDDRALRPPRRPPQRHRGRAQHAVPARRRASRHGRGQARRWWRRHVHGRVPASTTDAASGAGRRRQHVECRELGHRAVDPSPGRRRAGRARSTPAPARTG